MTNAGSKLIKAAKEARAIAAGDRQPVSVMVAADIDVRAIRSGLELSQEQFASRFGFSVGQIRDWEQNRNRPIQAMRAYLLLIKQKPDFVFKTLQKYKEELVVGYDEKIA